MTSTRTTSMGYKRFFFVGICVFLFSCNPTPKFYNPDIIKYKETRTDIDTIILHDSIDLCTSIRNILCIDEFLIIVQENNQEFFKILNTSNDSVLATFGQVGHAGNEFITIPHFVYCTRDEEGNPLLCIQEKQQTKVLDLEKSVKENNAIVKNIIKEEKDCFFYQIFHLNGNREFIYKTVTYNDPRDGIFSPPKYFFHEGNKEKEWNIYPNIIKPQFKNGAIDSYYSKTSISPNGKHIVDMNCFIDLLTVFDLETKQSTGIMNPESYTFEYLEKEITEENVEQKIKFYNTFACATDKRFFVIEDGDYYFKDKRKQESVISEYNWKGVREKVYKLNKRFTNIAFCEKNQKLYLIEEYEYLYNFILK